ncbi:hypothetical protein DFH08DRAFT_811922 [Mycena albidolilacea]|uniref:Uncharacterized protein n=1 Tax=Mycena albidolilacea TaxID=1033008 RepID=A0AAD6ZUW6_9AGAR|nr:hypothetical protein DFH08DRAFT_811922 [Mycena albidolilacea]
MQQLARNFTEHTWVSTRHLANAVDQCRRLFEDRCGVPRPDAENAWLEALHPPNKVVPAFHNSKRNLTKEQVPDDGRGKQYCLFNPGSSHIASYDLCHPIYYLKREWEQRMPKTVLYIWQTHSAPSRWAVESGLYIMLNGTTMEGFPFKIGHNVVCPSQSVDVWIHNRFGASGIRLGSGSSLESLRQPPEATWWLIRHAVTGGCG